MRDHDRDQPGDGDAGPCGGGAGELLAVQRDDDDHGDQLCGELGADRVQVVGLGRGGCEYCVGSDGPRERYGDV